MSVANVTVSPALKHLLAFHGAEKHMPKVLNLTAVEVRKLLARRTPRDTGDTARRWQVIKAGEKSGSALSGTAIVFNDSEIAFYLEYGTGVHSNHPDASRERIVPIKANALGPIYFRNPEVDAATPGTGKGPFFFASIAGMKPRFIVRGAMAKIRDILEENTKFIANLMLEGDLD